MDPLKGWLFLLAGLFSLAECSSESLEKEKLREQYLQSKFFSAHLEHFGILYGISFWVSLVLAGFWYFGKISVVVLIVSVAISGILILLGIFSENQRERLRNKFENEYSKKG